MEPGGEKSIKKKRAGARLKPLNRINYFTALMLRVMFTSGWMNLSPSDLSLP